MNNTPLLQARGLVKRYAGITAIDGLSLTLAHGETLGIIGPNGAGKSTLIGMLGGALRADGGSVELEGQDLGRHGAAERAHRGIGRTYQIPQPFLGMTVRENLLAARFSLHPFARRRDAFAACDGILECTGLSAFADRLAGNLPLLRRKRLEVARTLALEPKVLLLDEVGAGLVDEEISELTALVQELKQEVGGIIIIEHVLRIVHECCDRLAVIHFGRKIAEGPTGEVLASEEVAAVYLGTADTSAPLATSSAAGPTASAVATAFVPHRQPLLELRSVRAGYGQARVLEGVSLMVHPGEVLAVLGGNGAGKTTLASVIAGIIVPSAGTILVDGHYVTGWGAHRISRQGIALCLEGRRIFGTLSVEENLLLAARGADRATCRRRLDRIYTLFPDLHERREHSGTSMSGGQQQMLAIGRALMAEPRLVIFDEISLGLAPVVMDRLYETLAELKRGGLTMIVVEQDVRRTLALADRVHVMEHGHIALTGKPADLLSDARLRNLYLGGVA